MIANKNQQLFIFHQFFGHGHLTAEYCKNVNPAISISGYELGGCEPWSKLLVMPCSPTESLYNHAWTVDNPSLGSRDDQNTTWWIPPLCHLILLYQVFFRHYDHYTRMIVNHHCWLSYRHFIADQWSWLLGWNSLSAYRAGLMWLKEATMVGYNPCELSPTIVILHHWQCQSSTITCILVLIMIYHDEFSSLAITSHHSACSF